MSADGNSSHFAVPMLPHSYANLSMSVPMNPAAPSTSSVTFAVPNGPAAAANGQAAGIIRRRRFSTAKIQPTRIKKVMQSDEEIGRMVQSVPVSIGRAMEHFAEKFLQASSDATQFSNSKTLTPQHMKQAMVNNPHFRFLEPLFREVTLPQPGTDNTVARVALSLKEQQQLQEQQKNELSSAILAAAQFQIQQYQLQQQQQQQQQQLEMQNQQHPQIQQEAYNPYMVAHNGMNGFHYPNGEQMPMTPTTPTTQLACDMNEMLTTAAAKMSYSFPAPQPQQVQKLTGVKRQSVDGVADEDKPKRGRPKKKKPERCIDDDLFEEASRNIAREDKDREMMPPPSLPIGGGAFPR